jgi:hypothetical protein
MRGVAVVGIYALAVMTARSVLTMLVSVTWELVEDQRNRVMQHHTDIPEPA